MVTGQSPLEAVPNLKFTFSRDHCSARAPTAIHKSIGIKLLVVVLLITSSQPSITILSCT